MLCNVRLKRRHDQVGLRVLAYGLHHQWILHEHLVRCNMSVLVLGDECLERNAFKSVHVLADWVNRHIVFRQGHKFLSVLDPQHI